MQWLIDIIAERVGERIGWRRRGQVEDPDFFLGNLIRDNAWHDMDLSFIVPSGADAVAMSVRLSSSGAGKAIRFRHPGVSTEHPRAMETTQLANINYWSDMMVSCDVDRHIQYRISTDPWNNIEITIKGWWLAISPRN